MKNLITSRGDPTSSRRFSNSLRCLSVLTVIFVTGCATLDKSECTEGNWQQIGFNDGNAGLASAERLADHTKACGKHGVAPDAATYQAGYSNGVNNFCRAANGVRLGRAGTEYNGVCPVALESQFLTAYVSGLKENLKDLENEEDRLKIALDGKRDTYYALKDADVEGEPLKEANDKIDAAKTAVGRNKTKQFSINELISKWSIGL